MAYMQRGNANREPSSVVVMPHSAPTVTAYLAQGRCSAESASGSAAVGLIAQYGTISVRAPDTRM